MDIISLNNCHFDKIIFYYHQKSLESLTNALEKLDLELYSILPRKRYKLIRKDERKILSSYGVISFKRRYYYDLFTKEYVYPLDRQIGLAKSARMTNELILKIFDIASDMTYEQTGKHLSDDFCLSKSTIFNTLMNNVVQSYDCQNIDENRPKVHLQIDEKYIGMTISKNKKRYYTATLFAGKELVGKKYRLLNKILLSSYSLPRLKKKINKILKECYKVKDDEEIFISGDLATYIQGFGSDLYCPTRYVPDKYHVYKTIRDAIPGLVFDSYSLCDDKFLKYLVKELLKVDTFDSRKLARLIKNNPKCFQSYLDKEYLGCSQEGQNSHVYAPRFGKYANRFNKSTIEKLSLVREAKITGAKIVISHKEINEDPVEKGYYSFTCMDDKFKEDIDTSQMKKLTKQLFDSIKYGNW